MLVDDATVAIENIHRIRHTGKPLIQSIIAGTSQIALPALMATLVICIVFSYYFINWSLSIYLLL